MTIARRLLIAAVAVFVAMALAGGGYYIGGRTAGVVIARTAQASGTIEGFDLFYEVWELVEKDYVGDMPADEVVARGAASGLVQAVGDDATALIGPEYAALSREDAGGSYEGIGASVRQTDGGYVAIAAVTAGGPADVAGILVGDVILAVDGDDVTERSMYEVISLVRGPADTTVRLTVGRPSSGETIEVVVERREIEIRTAEVEMLSGGIAHIRLSDFDAEADSELREAIEQAKEHGATGIVLDLRDNPGGYLEQAVAVADEFLPSGLVVTERGRDGAEKAHRAHDGGAAEDLPLVVIINGGSASASEIVAGAIQARGRGLLVGEVSYGKGSVQLPFPLSDGSELRVTTAQWYTPDERLIQGSGLTPDITVAAGKGGSDPQLQTALDCLLETSR